MQNYRLFDFSPYQLREASIDTMGNLGVEIFSTSVYKYLLTQFSELVQLRFDIQNKQKIIFNQGQYLVYLVEQNQNQFDDDD